MFNEKFINTLIEDAKSFWPERWPEIENYFQKCCFAISHDIIMKYCGLFNKKGDTETLNSMKQKISLNPGAEYPFQKMLDILVEENVIKKDNNNYQCIDPMPDIPGAAECLCHAIKEIPEEVAAFTWLSRGFDGLYQFIKGKISGEEAMFGPWSDFSLVEQVYYTSKVYLYWSKIAGKTIHRLIDEEFKNKKPVILEIGAGTGSGTFEIFNSVGDPHNKIEKYIFTDIHHRLVKKASKKFTNYPFMEFKELDVTKPLEDQDINIESADILYAVNVMHAINKIENACDTMFKLVKPGGFIVLGEISPPINKLYRYMELTFGLLASYFQYDDKDVRPDSPILRPEQWIEHLKKSGFSDAVAVPGHRLVGCDRGGSIIAKK